MDILDIIITDSAESLKCFACGNYLSHFPISLCSNNQNICGRCQIPFALENEVFETVCRGLKFPCRYNNEGCWTKLFPEDVPQHEETCQYKPLPCVISKPNQCQWTGSPTLVSHHFQEEHSDRFLTNGEFELDLLNSEERDSLLKFQKQIFVFNWKFDCNSKVLRCAIYLNQCGSEVNYNCHLRLKSNNSTLLHDLQPCSFSKKDFVELNLVNLSLGGTKVNGKIIITRDTQPELPEEINQQLLSLLQCSACSRFATSSINHSLECKFRNTKCPAVGSFEKLSQLVHYPCKYKESGCSISLNTSELPLHIEYCEYKLTQCPLLKYDCVCKWSGKKQELVDHLLNNHEPTLASNSCFKIKLREDAVTCEFIKFSNRLFRLTYWADQTRFFWGVEEVGTFEGKFLYEVEILDRTESGQKLLMRKPCIPLGDKVTSAEYSYFDAEQIQPFVQKNVKESDLCIKFKIRISHAD